MLQEGFCGVGGGIQPPTLLLFSPPRKKNKTKQLLSLLFESLVRKSNQTFQEQQKSCFPPEPQMALACVGRLGLIRKAVSSGDPAKTAVLKRWVILWWVSVAPCRIPRRTIACSSLSLFLLNLLRQLKASFTSCLLRPASQLSFNDHQLIPNVSM